MSLETLTLSGWTPEFVKAAIRNKGVTLRELGERHGYSEAYIRNALYRPLFQAEQIIAKFIGVPAEQIWPDRYDIHGNPDCRKWSAPRLAKFAALRRRAAR